MVQQKLVVLVSHRKSTMAAADISFSVESGRLS
jgi:ATP-binding cassette subfamily C protein